MASSLEAARQQWAEGNRRLESHAAEPDVYRRLLDLVEVATEELRKRVGERFTLAQLADVYQASDGWMYEAVGERAATPGWPRQLSLVQDAAFHRYARGASDYSP